MRRPSRPVHALLAAATAAPLLAAPPVAAQGIETPFFIARIRSVTPDCRSNPGAPVVGRVSGIMSGAPSRGVSFVGCFDDMVSCERWRLFVSGQIQGHLIQNRCEPRS